MNVNPSMMGLYILGDWPNGLAEVNDAIRCEYGLVCPPVPRQVNGKDPVLCSKNGETGVPVLDETAKPMDKQHRCPSVALDPVAGAELPYLDIVIL